MSPDPTVSVVVPTYNRRDRLEHVLDALFAQRADVGFEIVVVSDGSVDGTDAYLDMVEVPAGTDVSLHHARQENSGPAAARNRGVAMATGEIVLFVDDDVVASEGLLQAHVDAHRREGDDVVVIGPMLDPPDHEMSAWVRWEQAMLYKQYAAMDAGEYEATARQFYTGNASIRREHLVSAGGFDTSFRRAEDVELAYRLEDRGLRFAYEDRAIAYHYAERSFAAWKSAAYVYGRNDVIFARDHARSSLMPYMAYKFGTHHAGIRVVTAACVRRPRLRRAVNGLMSATTRVLGRVGLASVARYALSIIYSVEYHTGVADELGSRDRFFEVVRADGR